MMAELCCPYPLRYGLPNESQALLASNLVLQDQVAGLTKRKSPEGVRGHNLTRLICGHILKNQPKLRMHVGMGSPA